MIQRWGRAVTLVVVVVSAWVACIGDEPSLATGRGAQGQPCLENGTCLSTLVCASGICDIGRDGGPSSASSSGSSSGPGTSTQHDLCGDVSTVDHLICPAEPKDDDCGNDRKCCLGRGCQQADKCSGEPPNPFVCFSGDHCKGLGANGACCVSGTLVPQVTKECGDIKELKLDTPETRPACQPFGIPCLSGALELCSLNGTKDCPRDMTCKPHALRLPAPTSGATYTRIVHVCVPP